MSRSLKDLHLFLLQLQDFHMDFSSGRSFRCKKSCLCNWKLFYQEDELFLGQLLQLHLRYLYDTFSMDFNNLYLIYKEKINSLNLVASSHLLLASIVSQQILFIRNGKSIKNYPISTSKLSPSCLEGSLGTHGDCTKFAKKLVVEPRSEQFLRVGFQLE